MEPLVPLFEGVTRKQFPMQKLVTLDQLAGYMRSWSAYTTYREANPEAEDPALR